MPLWFGVYQDLSCFCSWLGQTEEPASDWTNAERKGLPCLHDRHMATLDLLEVEAHQELKRNGTLTVGHYLPVDLADESMITAAKLAPWWDGEPKDQLLLRSRDRRVQRRAISQRLRGRANGDTASHAEGALGAGSEESSDQSQKAHMDPEAFLPKVAALAVSTESPG